MKRTDDTQVCNHCGSPEVARCKWVNVNDDTIYNADSGTTLEWCMNCKEKTTIQGFKEFKDSFLEKHPDNSSKPSCEECGSSDIQYHHTNDKNGDHYMKCNECSHVFEASLR